MPGLVENEQERLDRLARQSGTAFRSPTVMLPTAQVVAPPPAVAAPAAPVLPPPTGFPAIGPDKSTSSTWSDSRSYSVATPEEDAWRLIGNQAAGREVEAARAAGGARVERASREAQLADEEAQAQAAFQAQAEAERLAKEKAYDDARKAEAETRARIAAEPPPDFFAGRPGSKIAAALMVGIGQFGAALSGTRNSALDIITKATDDYIADKRDKARQAIEGAARSTDEAKSAMGLVEQRLQTTHTALLENLLARRKQVLAKGGSKEAQIASDFEVAGLERQIAERNAAAEQTRRVQINSGSGGSSSTSNASMNAEARAERAAAREATTKGGNEGSPVFGPGGQEVARLADPKAAKEASTNIAAARDVLSEIDKMRASFQAHGNESWGEEAEKRDAIKAGLMLKLKNLEATGALDKGMIEIADKMIPTNPGRFTDGGAKQLEQFRSMVASSAANKLDAYGLKGEAVMGAVGGPGEAVSGEPKKLDSVGVARIQRALESMPAGDPRRDQLVALLKERR